MKDYIIIVPLYSKVLVKGAKSQADALIYAKDKALEGNKKCQFDFGADPEIFEADGEEFCHLISEP